MTRAFLLFGFLALCSCGGDSTSVDGGTDAGALDAPAADLPGTDAACRDADSDGHGAMSCGGDDCDDADPNRYPGNTEICDSVDQDCDPATFGPDSDGDGSPSDACCNGGVCGTDCDDTRATINATAVEACNGIDDDCDGTPDDGAPMMLCYGDGDGDTYATASAASHMACSCASTETSRAPSGPLDIDCNDAASTAHPGGTDICDGLDNDCDGTPDNGAGAAYYQDCDGDGYGDMAVSRLGCTVPTVATSCLGGTWRTMPFDCDDTRGTVHPGALETCNTRDDDCNTVVDEVLASTVASDTANCGECGHTCLHGMCRSGVCTGDYVEIHTSGLITCARRGDGRVDCWGQNSGGSLATGSTTPTLTTPHEVLGLTDAVSLSVHRAFACVVRAIGSVVCWGTFGTTTYTTPTDLGGYSDATHVAVGEGSVFVLHGGTLAHPRGTIGPTGPSLGTDVVQLLYVSDGMVCAVHATGTVTCAQDGEALITVAGIGDMISADCTVDFLGNARCAGAARDGTVYSWNFSTVCAPCRFISGTSGMSGVTDGVQVSGNSLRHASGVVTGIAGGATSFGITDSRYLDVSSDLLNGCIIRHDDHAACWGENGSGALGDGTTTDSPSTPVTVSGS